MSLRRLLFAGLWADTHASTIKTANGRLAVRPLTTADAEMTRAFIDGMSAESRHFRFFQSFRAIPQTLLERLVRNDGVGLALVAISSEAGEPRIVGEIRYNVTAAGDVADFAIAVDDDWQYLGVGRGLLERLERAARKNGIHHLVGEVLAANDKMLQFARSRGFQICRDREMPGLLRIAKTLID